MAQQEQKQKVTTKAPTEQPAAQPKDEQNAELDADVSDMLEEIDSVLEKQFDFALHYVQAGGQ